MNHALFKLAFNLTGNGGIKLRYLHHATLLFALSHCEACVIELV